MFMRHLCEPEVPNTECYADGVPKNSIPRQNILTRIGMLRLIKNKVSIIIIFMRPLLLSIYPFILLYIHRLTNIMTSMEILVKMLLLSLTVVLLLLH